MSKNEYKNARDGLFILRFYLVEDSAVIFLGLANQPLLLLDVSLSLTLSLRLLIYAQR